VQVTVVAPEELVLTVQLLVVVDPSLAAPL
jgi:hypothetical protein